MDIVADKDILVAFHRDSNLVGWGKVVLSVDCIEVVHNIAGKIVEDAHSPHRYSGGLFIR